MRKSTRLNDMMIFLNDKSFFNLKDIMQEYGISKSTAIRDIQSLEEIGMPIFSETGRNGRYGILKNRLLSPIIFTVDEMYALYFAMLTLNAYESTPFHLSIGKLKKKFETCLSDELISNIHKMERTLSLEGTKHYNSSPYSYVGDNRVSLNVTLFQNGSGPIQLSAIAAGGSQAMLFKINTWGEEAFLDKLKELL